MGRQFRVGIIYLCLVCSRGGKQPLSAKFRIMFHYTNHFVGDSIKVEVERILLLFFFSYYLFWCNLDNISRVEKNYGLYKVRSRPAPHIACSVMLYNVKRFFTIKRVTVRKTLKIRNRSSQADSIQRFF